MQGQLGEQGFSAIFTGLTASDVPHLEPVTQVAAGMMHTCALTVAGGVKCWGANWFDQLGNGTTDSSSTPTQVVGLESGAIAISAGALHTCALMATGGVKCWGLNPQGQLGDGTDIARTVPVDVVGLQSGVTAISAGGSNACALMADGSVKCWGDDSYQQIGDGACEGPDLPLCLNSPRRVPATVVGLGAPAVGLSVGGTHVCAVLSSGAVKCWGDWARVKPSTSYTASPAPLALPADTSISSGAEAVAAGSSFTCVLLSSGSVQCWGINNAGQLGDGTLTGRVEPAFVTGFAPNSRSTQGARAIEAGFSHACAITDQEQAVCWGANSSGQVGNNQTASSQPVPASVVSYSSQTIDFPAIPDHMLGDPPFQLVVTASSGLPVSLSSATPFVCTVSGFTVTLVSVGACSIVATRTGNEEYRDAFPMERTFQVRANLKLTVGFTGSGSGSVTSSPGGIACPSTCEAIFVSGSVITLTATPSAGSIFGGWLGPCAGSGTCTLTLNSMVGVTAVFKDGSVVDPPPGVARFVNLSTRMRVQTGDDVMIAGFIVGGTVAKKILVRVAGPSLAQNGIANPLLNPALLLVRSADSAIIASNDDWQNAGNAGDILASGFAPNHSLEPAIMMSLEPGAYTAVVHGAGGGTGVGLIGIFEMDHPEVPIINISTRGKVLTGEDVMIAGFIIQGDTPQRVVINVAGPSLAASGIPNPLANPQITLVRSSDRAILATNDSWQTQANPADVSAIQATGFQPNNALEPAIIATLPPGAYTAIVSGFLGGTGVALVGVFRVP